MIDNISTKDLILKVVTWKKTFMWITIITALATGLTVFIIPKQYKSTAILFPARQFSVSKLVIEANVGNQEDYMIFGDADDTEKLMQLLLSDGLKLRVANAFDLWTRWDIDKKKYAFHFLKLTWDDMVTIRRTEYNSVKIEVYDYTAEGAAQIANGISDYMDSVRYDMNREVTGGILKIVKEEYDNTLQRMKVLEDSLYELRQLGVLQYKEQVKAYSKSYAKAIEKNDVGAMKRLEAKLDTLKKYGSSYQNMKDRLDKYTVKYPDIKMKYDEALINYNKMIPLKFVVEKAFPNDFKAKPVRIIIIALSVLAANLVALFFLLIKEKFGKSVK